MADLCLGTVQFGMNYGVNNQIGRQPTQEESFGMIEYALQNGIKCIDTARAYGTAELVLGAYIEQNGIPKDVSLISKLRPNVVEEGEKDVCGVVRRECEDTLRRLHIDKLNGYLLHTPEYIYQKEIVDGMVKLKEEGLVENIGVSIYDIKEGEYALQTGVVDYIQLPYSILDQRGMRTGFIPKAKKSGIKIFTRSAFLQGLILMDKAKIPAHLSEAVPMIEKYESLVQKYEEDEVRSLIHFVADESEIDYLVFGVEEKQQLEQKIQKFHEKKMPAELMKEIKKEITNLEQNIIFPSLWSNGKKAE